MESSGVLIAVVVVAAMALLARLLLLKKSAGKIDWPTLCGALFLVGLFLGLFFGIDAYRLDIWREGSASAADCRYGHVVGREAGEGVLVSDEVRSDGMPMFFALNVEGVRPSGYWRLKQSGTREETAQRTVEESREGDGKIAITRVVSHFDVVKKPSDESLYAPVSIATLPGGQQVLWVSTDYDAHEGRTPIGSLHPLAGKMAEIASSDSLVNQEVFFMTYDSQRERTSATSYIATRALVALVVVLLLGGIGVIVRNRILRRKK